jgi:transposase-like protein
LVRLLDICAEFSSEEDCFGYLERLRWPSGVQCPRCLEKKISRIATRGKSGKPRHLYQCLICRTQFSIRTGTIFQDSHLPLTAWFKAIALVGAAKEVNVNVLKRELNVHHRTASYLLSRIQQAMAKGGELEV